MKNFICGLICGLILCYLKMSSHHETSVQVIGAPVWCSGYNSETRQLFIFVESANTNIWNWKF